jgi:hypothetical protein
MKHLQHASEDMKHLKHGVSYTCKKHMKTLEKAIENICSIQINTLATCVKYMQHTSKLKSR